MVWASVVWDSRIGVSLRNPIPFIFGDPIGIQSTGPQAGHDLLQRNRHLGSQVADAGHEFPSRWSNTLDDKTTFWVVEVGNKTPWFYIWFLRKEMGSEMNIQESSCWHWTFESNQIHNSQFSLTFYDLASEKRLLEVLKTGEPTDIFYNLCSSLKKNLHKCWPARFFLCPGEGFSTSVLFFEKLLQMAMLPSGSQVRQIWRS